MEDYLKRQYNVIEIPEIENALDIENYFTKNGHNFFNIDDGDIPIESMDHLTRIIVLILKIEDKFFQVHMKAKGYSSNIPNHRTFETTDLIYVRSHEIPKPKELFNERVDYSLKMTNNQRRALEKFMKDIYIDVNVVNEERISFINSTDRDSP